MHDFGGPEVLVYEEAPRPIPQDNEVLVRVRAAGVNPLDYEVREGKWGVDLPIIPGWDFSGTIEEIGPNAVCGFRVGDEVYGRADLVHGGAYAEYVVARSDHVAKKPRTIDHVHAAAVPTAGLLAWQALFATAAKLEAHQTILVHGAATGAGTFVVQLARWRGAKVIATADPSHVMFLRNLGVHLVIDERRHRFEDVLHDVDAVIDLVGGSIQSRSWSVLKKGGVLASSGEPLDPRVVQIVPVSNATQLTALSRLIDARIVRVIVSHVLPLDHAREAHELPEREPGIVLEAPLSP